MYYGPPAHSVAWRFLWCTLRYSRHIVRCQGPDDMTKNSERHPIECLPASTRWRVVLVRCLVAKTTLAMNDVISRSVSPVERPLEWVKHSSSRCDSRVDSFDKRGSQHWPICWSTDGGIHEAMHQETVLKSVNGVDETSFRVHRAPSLTLQRHCLQSQDVPRRNLSRMRVRSRH